jgi:hypothetical protein
VFHWIDELKNGAQWMQKLRQRKGFGKEGMEMYPWNFYYITKKGNCCISQKIVDLLRWKRIRGD